MGVCQSNPENASNKASPQKYRHDYAIKIQANTWVRDSHGLFDYECNETTQQILRLQGPNHSLCRKDGENIFVESENGNHELSKKKVLQVSYEANRYWVNPTLNVATNVTSYNPFDDERSMWMVSRFMKGPLEKGTPVAEGDYIKFGRVRYKVKELRGLKGVSSANNHDNSGMGYDDKIGDIDGNMEAMAIGTDGNLKACRICLAEGNEFDNPLIAPCDCCGTMKYVHLRCLQHWLANRAQTRHFGIITTIIWKSFDCELCKKELTDRFKADGKTYDLVDYKRPDGGPFLIFEILSKDLKHPKGVHIINMSSKNTAKLGRGHDCDLRIPDISVSRFHATIRYDNGEFFIDDNNSKFGTLILIQNGVALQDETSKVTVQVGRSIFTVNLEKIEHKEFFASKCCLSSGVPPEKEELIETIIKSKAEAHTHVPNSASVFSPQNFHPHMSMPQSPMNYIDDDDVDLIPDEFHSHAANANANVNQSN